MVHNFRAQLQSGDTLLGTMVSLASLASPAIAEILTGAGFDWLFIDGEHGSVSTGQIEAIIQATKNDVPCAVRVASADAASIQNVLDVGASGIVAPQVNTAEQAERVVQFARYSPQGTRGVGLARAHGYGLQFSEYIAQANDRVAVIVQAEHVKAVENIESIVQVDGVDAVLIGPYDLSASYGRMGQVDHPDVTGGIDHVVAACQKAGMPLGIFGLTADSLQPYIKKGFTLIIAATDALHLIGAAKSTLSELRTGQ